MIYSCCASLGMLDAVERAGYERIILPGTEVAAWSDGELTAVVERLRRSPLTCRALNSFCTPELILCGPNYDPEKVKAYIDRLAPRAAALGAEYIGVGSPKSRSIPDGFDKELAMEQWCETLTILCDACAPHGITVLLEAVCALEGNWMTTTTSALEVVRRMGREDLQIVFDTYHAFIMSAWYMWPRTSLSIATICAGRILASTRSFLMHCWKLDSTVKWQWRPFTTIRRNSCRLL